VAGAQQRTARREKVFQLHGCALMIGDAARREAWPAELKLPSPPSPDAALARQVTM
jgi:hypothetical protein